jgi:hypothetical protein
MPEDTNAQHIPVQQHIPAFMRGNLFTALNIAPAGSGGKRLIAHAVKRAKASSDAYKLLIIK